MAVQKNVIKGILAGTFAQCSAVVLLCRTPLKAAVPRRNKI